MAGNFTNQLQAAVLFEDDRSLDLPSAIRPMLDWLAEKDFPVRVVQETPSFLNITGPHELFLTVEFIDRPAEPAVLEATLGSGFVRQTFPDCEEVVARHRTHALVEVRQGVIPDFSDNPEIANFLKEMNMASPGKSLNEYTMRCDILVAACQVLLANNGGCAVHWTPSNFLIAARAFEAFSKGQEPRVLSVHPILIGGEQVAGFDDVAAGLVTIGAADYVGREIHVVPAPVPWMEQVDAAMGFIRIAIAEGGYIIPDDDTFGVDTDEFSYRVRHFEAGTPGAYLPKPHFRLTLERHEATGWRSPDFRETTPIDGGISGLSQMLDPENPVERARMDEISQKDQKLRGLGGRLNVSIRNDGPDAFVDPAGKSPNLSAVPELGATEDDDYDIDRPLDPNDPMDAAIIKRLRERESSAPSPAAASGDQAQSDVSSMTPHGSLARVKPSFGRRKGGFETRH